MLIQVNILYQKVVTCYRKILLVPEVSLHKYFPTSGKTMGKDN